MPRRKKPGRKAPNPLTVVFVSPLPTAYQIALDKWIERTNYNRFMRDREIRIRQTARAQHEFSARLVLDTLIKRSGALRAERVRELYAEAREALSDEIGTGIGSKQMGCTRELAERMRRYVCTSERDPARAITLAYLLRGWLEARGYVTNAASKIDKAKVTWAHDGKPDDLEI